MKTSGSGGLPSRSRLALALSGAALLTVSLAGPIRAQAVSFTPQAESRAQRRLAEFLEGGDYRIWSRDTILSGEDRVSGNVLVLEAVVRAASEVEGSLYVVDGDLFLRPGARVSGDVVVLGGGFYRSGMAEVEGEVVYRPNELLRVMPEDGGYAIFAVTPRPEALELGGLYGFRVPTYQRVDGWTFEWRGLGRAVELPWQPELEASVRFRAGDGELEGSVRQVWHPTGGLRFGFEASRATRSNEGWIRRDFPNTLSFLFLGNDYRNYYRADRAGVLLGYRARSGWRYTLGGRWEEARSAEAQGTEILFEPDSVRPNPPVDPGDTWSLLADVDYRRRTAGRRTYAHFLLEGASAEVAGDFSFLMGEAQVQLRRPVVAGHAVELLAVARGDLAGRLPRQRWSAIGGIGTLPTFPILSLRGERMFLGEVTYVVPVPPLAVPVAGDTELFVRGAIGSAWSEGESLRAEQNVMVGARFLFFEAALAADPGESDLDLQFFVGARFPRELGAL